MRLDKFLSQNTEYSRSQIRKLAKSGLISVNNISNKDVSIQLGGDDKVSLNGELIRPIAPAYYMLHKPTGYVCANSDNEHPTVLDLVFTTGSLATLDPGFAPPQINDLQIAGRLDLDTTGLVLLTNDGNWNHKVTSPNSHCGKTYLVEVDRPLEEQLIEQFTIGIILDGESKPTLPSELCILSEYRAKLTLHEGKYHQVKRMFAAMGNHVTKLHRESIGTIHLDIDEGHIRLLSPSEISQFT